MNVRVIPAIPKFAPTADSPIRKKRVASYARVSTDLEEQQTSYEAQIDYYTKYINEKPEWEFVKVFTDEGISATNTKKRDGFNEMIKRALNGEIDLIITKSVSRFARNTVDTLTTVRMLKEKGVEVYFDRQDEEVKRERVAKGMFENVGGDGSVMKKPVKKAVKIGRNDPCPCGSGLKWKKCTCKEYHD